MLMLHRSERGWDPLEGGRLRSERPRLVAVLLTLILDHARRAEIHDVNLLSTRSCVHAQLRLILS